jgi:hypothetical protein
MGLAAEPVSATVHHIQYALTAILLDAVAMLSLVAFFGIFL